LRAGFFAGRVLPVLRFQDRRSAAVLPCGMAAGPFGWLFHR